MSKITITPFENGPLKVTNTSGEVLKNVFFFEEKPQDLEDSIFLCRCGKTSNQPFCDGTHNKAGFISQNELEDEIIQEYQGEKIKIIFNRSICAGASKCANSYPSIYKSAAEDWINPDGASVDEVINSVKACPSGALSYEIDSRKTFESHDVESVEIIKGGPINFKGKIELEDVKWSSFANKEKFALCRCGASKNKPFCDYTHASLDDESLTF